MTTYRRTAGAVWRALPVGVLVRRPGASRDALTLTGPAAEVWRALDRPCTLEMLERAAPGTLDAVEQLVAVGLVTDEAQLQ